MIAGTYPFPRIGTSFAATRGLREIGQRRRNSSGVVDNQEQER
jgi:hypothetical protein